MLDQYQKNIIPLPALHPHQIFCPSSFPLEALYKVVFHMNIMHIFCTHATEYMEDIEVNPSNDAHVDIKQET